MLSTILLGLVIYACTGLILGGGLGRTFSADQKKRRIAE